MKEERAYLTNLLSSYGQKTLSTQVDKLRDEEVKIFYDFYWDEDNVNPYKTIFDISHDIRALLDYQMGNDKFKIELIKQQDKTFYDKQGR